VVAVYDLTERKAAAAAKPDPARLPPQFWDATPELRHILDTARRVHASPDLVLGNTLARLAAILGHRWVIPPYRGDERPLSIWVGNVGPSSAGKSIAHGIARKLLPDAPPRCHLHLVPATGEAWLESFWTETQDTDPATGKPVTIKTQAIDSALIIIDEGSLLNALFQRTGSSLQSFLLTMFHGGDVGTATLDTQKRGLPRALRRGTYNACLSVALQPALAQSILEDEGIGWPQRFWFCKAGDHIAEEHEPAPVTPLPWAPPHPTAAEQVRRQTADGTRRLLIGYPDTARRDTMDIARADVLGLTTDPLAGNDQLLRLKLAALLTSIHSHGESMDVTDRDYDLAGTMVATHQQCRRELVGHAATAAEAVKRAAADQVATAAVASDLARETLWLARAKAKINQALAANGGTATRTQVWRLCSVNIRGVLDHALADMVADGVIERVGPSEWRYLKQGGQA
jgi:hypothetical protein